MSVIQVTDLSFAYDGSYDSIFEHVNFRLDTDWKLGFIGRNGRGKTTFLNLLLGKYEYSGTISAGVLFEYFPYEVTDKRELTLDVVSRICPEIPEWEIYRELNLLEVEADVLFRPFDTLSNGEQTKTLLAALFLKENHFLLIDEPTNHLDAAARKAVGEYLKKKCGFILVSHDRSLLDCCVDHILSINKTNIEIQSGNFSSWWQNKQQQDRFELDQNKRLRKEIGRLNAAARRTSDWSDKTEKTKYTAPNAEAKPDRGYVGHKAAKMMKRSKAIQERQQNAIDEKSKLLKNIETTDSLKLFPLSCHADRLAELQNVSLFYGDKAVCENITFSIRQGDRIALCGKNGCGKSTILKLICGEALSYEGDFFKGSQLKISYVPQDTAGLSGNLKDYAQALGIEETLFLTILRKLDFERSQFDKDISLFSAGQKKKVLIAGSLCEKAHLYVWDEPLNYIDIFSRMQIEELILQYTPTLLFVEHDSAFCQHIATRTVMM